MAVNELALELLKAPVLSLLLLRVLVRTESWVWDSCELMPGPPCPSSCLSVETYLEVSLLEESRRGLVRLWLLSVDAAMLAKEKHRDA